MEYLTLHVAAKYLGVSRMKLYRLIQDGKLVTVLNDLDNREKLISKDQLDRLKAKNNVVAPEPKLVLGGG